MKLAICDDEKNIRDYLAKCACEVSDNLSIVFYEDANGITAPDFDADILFLDIQLPGMDGMQAARLLRDAGKKTVLVFVTALEEYVFHAFDVGAFQYLVKPFDEQKLKDVLEKAIRQVQEQKSIECLLEKVSEQDKKTITVKSGKVNRRVFLSTVAYAEVYDRQIILHLDNRDTVEYYGRMKQLEKIAGFDFFRVHRSYLVNLGYVKSYDSKYVWILDSEIPVSRGKYQELVKAYLSYHTRREHF